MHPARKYTHFYWFHKCKPIIRVIISSLDFYKSTWIWDDEVVPMVASDLVRLKIYALSCYFIS